MNNAFVNDYSAICADEILKRLTELSNDSFVGYGLDDICDSARKKIMKKLGDESVDIHFVSGGTQANALVIGTMLRPYQSIISPDSGHINVHECGAIELTGHKVEAIKNINGKLDLEAAEKLILAHEDEHTTAIKAIYFSDTTEFGTIYKLEDLKAMRALCDKYGLYLYMDGARLGSAMTCEENDIAWTDLTKYLDCFYIGATKNGGMLGEAIVVINDDLKPGFRRMMKQRGAMLAKGFLLGVQYDCLFTDDLLERLARHENKIAMKLKKGLIEKGYRFLMDSPTNQQFIIMPNEKVEILQQHYNFAVWEKGEPESCIRLVCSFRTTEEDVDKILSYL